MVKWSGNQAPIFKVLSLPSINVTTERNHISAPRRVELERQRDKLRENILQAKRELEKVEFALRVLTQDLFAEVPAVDPLVITPGGTIKNLPDHVVKLLEHTGRAMSISEMTDVWFDFSMPMTPAELKRRLSVTTSAMYRNPEPNVAPRILPSGFKNNKREIFWALPSFMQDGKILDQHKPIMDTEPESP